MKYLTYVVVTRPPKTLHERRVNNVLQLFNRQEVTEDMIEKEAKFLQTISSQLARMVNIKDSPNYIRLYRLAGRKDVVAFKIGSFARIQFVRRKDQSI